MLDDLLLCPKPELARYLKSQVLTEDQHEFNLMRFVLALEWKMNEHIKLELRK